jgi:hypothetical protein
MQTPFSCHGSHGNLLHVKERLAIYNSLLIGSLQFFYGQHDIVWGLPTALHVPMMLTMYTSSMKKMTLYFEAIMSGISVARRV